MFEIYLSSYSKRIYRKRAKITSFVGMIFILLISSLLHFGFEFFGRIKWTAIVFAVNESVWEHLKIGFFGGFIFYIIEYIIYGRRFENFIVGKSVALFLIPFLTAIFYFLYTAFLADNLFLDILTLVLAIIIAQLVSLKITLSQKKIKKAPFVILIILLLIIFPLFTYFPPKIPQLFYDFAHKRYGI
ncbi:hypothetical protein COB47_0273 [Caldicellulosiruptor obsidiansis OB47]|uniref:Uncharacterized protein n=1 Tax=Caldicellulosiruptor obsidiansis (strain ATCC BAA-2073 / JCM 16842 / OB47) TaxID=608506 RepID=D9THY8_CALOO|nr:DUF6512 family protein [Caldicellulosiruptor obsidiansis]ADL41620.1 hypothetical protein COB47_0273 [Caldicellulosiruptor obsidiansis OB47]